MSNRLKKTRIVTFKEDYKDKKGKIIYKKGSEHPVHEKTVDVLLEGGAKISHKKFDYETAIEKAKQEFEEAEDKAKEGKK